MGVQNRLSDGHDRSAGDFALARRGERGERVGSKRKPKSTRFTTRARTNGGLREGRRPSPGRGR
eukprot:8136840-Pyramimonas_sp.AAC.1